MKQTLTYRLLAAVVLTIGIIGCGDPTDNPEDCTKNEFFDDGSELCRTCPALTPPSCVDGCGFFIAPEEDRPCPEAVCLIPDGEACVCPESHPECSTETCAADEVFDATSFECVSCDISCDGTLEVVDGACACRT